MPAIDPFTVKNKDGQAGWTSVSALRPFRTAHRGPRSRDDSSEGSRKGGRAFRQAREKIDFSPWCWNVALGRPWASGSTGVPGLPGGACLIMSVQDSGLVSAMQRKATVVQKSLEGFDLTVTFACGRGRRVVAGNVRHSQRIRGRRGQFLVNSSRGDG